MAYKENIVPPHLTVQSLEMMSTIVLIDIEEAEADLHPMETIAIDDDMDLCLDNPAETIA